MAILRIYPSKSNTIASGEYRLYNSGQNAVTELWYGGGFSSETTRRNSISRFLVDFDITDLQTKISNLDINTALTVTYKLKMKNAIPRSKVLEKEYDFEALYKQIAASYDLICWPVDKSWDSGRGYDMYKERYLVKQEGNVLITGYSNWDSATRATTWTESGVYTNPTASTFTYATQHFDIGDEDIDMDVTSIVNSWLSGSSQNYGLGVSFSREYELVSSDTRYIASFFTDNTNTTFKPYLEVSYNQVIKDDRRNVTNNRISRLFLYTFSGNNAVNYYSAGTVDIVGNTSQSGLVPTQLERGVYYIDVDMSAATPGQKYSDVWNGVTFVPGVDKQTITQTFQVQNNYYTSKIPGVNEYFLVPYGIDNGKTFTIGEIVRVFCDLKQNFSTNAPTTAFDLQYRMIQNSQLEVVPWTQVNQTVLDGCAVNYFVVDTSWLQHNQTYKIEFKMVEVGSHRLMSDTITFKVQRPF